KVFEGGGENEQESELDVGFPVVCSFLPLGEGLWMRVVTLPIFDCRFSIESKRKERCRPVPDTSNPKSTIGNRQCVDPHPNPLPRGEEILQNQGFHWVTPPANLTKRQRTNVTALIKNPASNNQTISGSLPTARSLTPTGSGNGCSTSSAEPLVF